MKKFFGAGLFWAFDQILYKRMCPSRVQNHALGEPAPLWYHDKKNLKIHLNHF